MVSRVHAILTLSQEGLILTKPVNLNNDIIVNGKLLRENRIKLTDNSEVQFAQNGPKIIAPFSEKKQKSKTTNSAGIPWTKILAIASYLFLLASIVIFILVYLNHN